MSSRGAIEQGRADPDPRIGGVAIRYADLGVVALGLPASHGEVRALVAQAYPHRRNRHVGQEGFVSDGGEFLTPRRAILVARRAGQLAMPPDHEELRVEDLARSWRRGARPRSPSRPSSGGVLADRKTLWLQTRRAMLSGAAAGAAFAAAVLIVQAAGGRAVPVLLLAGAYLIACAAAGMTAGWIAAAGTPTSRLGALVGCGLVVAACTAQLLAPPPPPWHLPLAIAFSFAAALALWLAARLRPGAALLMAIPLAYLAWPWVAAAGAR